MLKHNSYNPVYFRNKHRSITQGTVTSARATSQDLTKQAGRGVLTSGHLVHFYRGNLAVLRCAMP